MIKTENGKLRIKGDICEIKADLSLIIHELYHNVLTQHMSQEEAKEEIMESVELGFLNHTEAAEATLDELMELLKDIAESLKEKGDK